ncbi:MAG: hypothetical protein AB8F74_08960 [Saprospiraceae bacterium]
MKRLFQLTVLLIGLSCLMSCHYKRAKSQPDLWFPLDFETNTPIRDVHTSFTEMKLLTDDEFLRVNINGEVIERRDLALPFNFFGRPAIGEFSFIRMVRAQVAYPRPNLSDSIVQKPLMEMHLTKQATQQIYRMDLDDFDLGENLSFEEFARYSGAYNDDESKYLVVTLNNSNGSNTVHSLYLMDLGLNAQKTQSSGITVDKRIDIELTADTRLVSNVKFLNGNFYVCTEFGAWRVNPDDGTAAKLANHWVKDAFAYNGRIYLTGFSDFDFYVSSDNGTTFGPVGNGGSPLKFVEVTNDQVFTQTQLGLPWSLAEPTDLSTITPVVINKDFEDSGAEYWNAFYFYNKYYISIQKQIFYTEDLQVED